MPTRLSLPSTLRLGVLFGILAFALVARGQQPDPPDQPDPPNQQAAKPEQIQEWIESLGSSNFTARERAASELMRQGSRVMETLRGIADKHEDPEVRIRAGEIIKQMQRGDLDLKIESFLAGDEVELEGWNVAQSILGDSSGVRELFVGMLRAYPGLTASLPGTPRDRALALEKVVAGIEKKMFVDRQFPEEADVIALLLPAADPNVPLDGAFEDVLMAVLEKPAATKLHQDDQLAGPFTALVGHWLPRSSKENRADVLFYGLSWELRPTLYLGLRTLEETEDGETLALAFQAIAKFGTWDDVDVVKEYLDKTDLISQQGFVEGKRLRTELGDLAMATIARLHNVPLTKIGFPADAFHKKFGFDVQEVGFPVDDDQARKQAREKIDELVRRFELPEVPGRPR